MELSQLRFVSFLCAEPSAVSLGCRFEGGNRIVTCLDSASQIVKSLDSLDLT